jgi:methyltransferase (TIGR00027 family)
MLEFPADIWGIRGQVFRRTFLVPASAKEIGVESVSGTALWAAALRAHESEREDALFVDDLAGEIAGEQGFALRERYWHPRIADSVAIRHRYLDEAIARHPELRQVVLLAAGLDARSVRLEWPAGTTLFEVDHADLMAWKEQRYAELGVRHRVDRRTVGVDLTEDWPGGLQAAGWDPAEPTLWVAEGLMFYLPEAAAHAFVKSVGEASAIGSVFAGDIVSYQFLISETEIPQFILPLLAEDDTPWQFGTDEPEDLLSGGGWEPTEVKCVGDDGVSFGRWPVGPIPRHIPGVPRSFVFVATKTH